MLKTAACVGMLGTSQEAWRHCSIIGAPGHGSFMILIKDMLSDADLADAALLPAGGALAATAKARCSARDSAGDTGCLQNVCIKV